MGWWRSYAVCSGYLFPRKERRPHPPVTLRSPEQRAPSITRLATSIKGCFMLKKDSSSRPRSCQARQRLLCLSATSGSGNICAVIFALADFCYTSQENKTTEQRKNTSCCAYSGQDSG